MNSIDIKLIKRFGKAYSDKWRIAISQTPSIWKPCESGNTKKYWFLKKQGLAVIITVYGNRRHAMKVVKELIKKYGKEKK